MLDGIIVIDKPKHYTSHDVVAKVKKILNVKKVGHTGTLDPNATGVLPILVGQGTKLSEYILNHDKEYIAVLKLGVQTDTADEEGKIINKLEVLEKSLKKEEIEKILKSFIGKQSQIPPMYSAIKVNGKKLYEYARKGEKVELLPRQVEIYNMELIRIDEEEKQITFKVSCSKGTYIRSLCEDIAKKLNTVGYMKELKRVKVGEFKIEDSIKIEDLEKKFKSIIKNNFITIEDFFKEKNKIILDDDKLKLFLNGVILKTELLDDIYRIYNKNKFIGVGLVKNNSIKRKIIVENEK